jgi:hypothetical protein
LITPGSTTATWSTSSISRIRFIRSIDSIRAPSTAFAPPDRPVRAPWGTTGMRCSVAQRSTVCTCSVFSGRATPRGLPAGQKLAVSVR